MPSSRIRCADRNEAVTRTPHYPEKSDVLDVFVGSRYRGIDSLRLGMPAHTTRILLERAYREWSVMG